MKASENRAAVPISECLLAAAADGATAEIRKLRARAVYIQRWNAISFWRCLHEPRCPALSLEEWTGLLAQIPDLAPLREHIFPHATI